MIFSEQQALDSVKIGEKYKNIIIKPAQIILEDSEQDIKQISVAKVLIDGKDSKQPMPKITNSGVYLISRGCIFEHLKSQFKPHKLDRQFTGSNKKIRSHLKKNKSNLADSVASVESEIDALKTKMSKNELTKKMKYKKKFASGKIIGL